jgi:two-component system cell cycle sensor histidine kinase/response regulator CckA
MAEKRILVVEDESIVAEDLRNGLINLGYSVPSVVSSGEKAINTAREISPDLVLMDIVLQGEMDGIEAAKQIRLSYDIPVLYLTSYSDDRILERAKITEPYGYIIKPFRERELHINIEIALYKHKMEKKLRESEQWLSSTLKSLGEGVITTDKNGNIKTMNPFAEALTGWKCENALEKPVSSVLNIISGKPGQKVENPVTKAIREGIFYGLVEHTILITKDGMKVPLDIIGSLMKDDKGEIMGIVLIFDDIIERKRVEEEIQRKY